MNPINNFQRIGFFPKTTFLIAAGLLFCAAILPACSPVEPAEGQGTPGGPGSTDSGIAGETAVLTGQVVFGPLTPVIVEGEPTPEIPPEAFEGRSVLIYLPDGETFFAEAQVGPDGVYRIELPPGDYVVDFTLVTIETSASVPAEITLSPGQVLEFDIDVDTGIR
jgi:hypothetical protein